MNNGSFLKVFSIIAFIAFMFVSCWATVESLHMILDWPVVFFWIATIGIFILSSLGASLIVDSFNQQKRVDHRGWRLIGGIVMLIVFWISFSLPTNTHTFFYRDRAKEIVMQDVGTTKGYLQQLSNNTKIENLIKTKQNNYEHRVWEAFKHLKAEIENPINTGFGQEAKNRLNDLNTVLEGEPLPVLSGSFTTTAKRQQLINAYQQLVSNRIADKKKEIALSTTPQQVSTFKAEAATNLKSLNQAESILKEKIIKGQLSNEDIDNTNVLLNKSYNTIKMYNEFVEFAKDKDGNYIDKDYYVPAEGKNIVTKTSRIKSVINVWQDFFKGKYKGMGFIYWILIAALVDIAGFIFFVISPLSKLGNDRSFEN